MKKKVVSVLMVMVALVCLSMCFSACGKDENIVGYWVTQKRNIQGWNTNITDDTYNFNLTINEDGTVTSSGREGNGSGSWTEENGEYKIVLVYFDGKLELKGTIDKKRLTLKRYVMGTTVLETYIMVKG